MSLRAEPFLGLQSVALRTRFGNRLWYFASSGTGRKDGMRIARPITTLGFLLATAIVPAFAQQGPPPGGPGGGRPGGGPPPGPPLTISSAAFTDGGMVPDKYTCAVGMTG